MDPLKLDNPLIMKEIFVKIAKARKLAQQTAAKEKFTQLSLEHSNGLVLLKEKETPTRDTKTLRPRFMANQL